MGRPATGAGRAPFFKQRLRASVVNAFPDMTTNAVILCPGPSLAAFLAEPPERDGSTVVIGVNRAAEVFPCDWWCAADHETIGGMRPMSGPGGRPRLCTQQQAIVLAHEKWPECGFVQPMILPANVRTFERLGQETDCPLKSGWTRLSMLAAMVLAENLMRGGGALVAEARRIDLYGCDWIGLMDFDGTTPRGAEVGRSDYRWGNERAHFDRVAAWLRGKGIEVERKRAPGAGGAA